MASGWANQKWQRRHGEQADEKVKPQCEAQIPIPRVASKRFEPQVVVESEADRSRGSRHCERSDVGVWANARSSSWRDSRRVGVAVGVGVGALHPETKLEAAKGEETPNVQWEE